MPPFPFVSCPPTQPLIVISKDLSDFNVFKVHNMPLLLQTFKSFHRNTCR